MATDTLSAEIKIQKTANSRISEVDFDNLVFGKLMTDHAFVADYTEGKWENFRIEAYDNLVLSPATSAIHYGQSIFEGLKAYKNAQGQVLVFRGDQNAKRINASARRMCMPEFPEELFMEAMGKLLDLDRAWVPSAEGCSLYIRPFIFATDAFLGLRPSETYKFMIICSPVGKYYSRPVKVKIETEYSRAAPGGTGSAKTAGNYAASMYPARLAQQQGYDQLIWTDGKEHAFVEEAGTMNVMFLFDDTLTTASIDDTILDGITRKSVLQLAKELGVKVEERKISVKEVIEAAQNGRLKEAFGVGTAATIAPIAALGFDGKDYHLPEIGEHSLSKRLFDEMENIKRGRTADTRGWIQTI